MATLQLFATEHIASVPFFQCLDTYRYNGIHYCLIYDYPHLLISEQSLTISNINIGTHTDKFHSCFIHLRIVTSKAINMSLPGAHLPVTPTIPACTLLP